MSNLFGLSAMKSNTEFAPLAVLGYRLQQRDFFAPLNEELKLIQKSIRYTPPEKLLTCLVSLLSGCRTIAQIDSRLRPDQVLATAWGLPAFAQQSTVADTLDSFTELNVAQLRAAIQRIYLREGHALQHDYQTAGPLILDIDLTGLPASKLAEGSCKGYFCGKKGLTGGNWSASVRRNITKPCSACCWRAIRVRA